MDTQPIQLKDGTTAIAFPSSSLKIEQHSFFRIKEIKKDDIMVGMNVKIRFSEWKSAYEVSGTVAERGEDNKTVSLIARRPIEQQNIQGQPLVREYKLVGFLIDLERHALKELDKTDVERLADSLTQNRSDLEKALAQRENEIKQNEDKTVDFEFDPFR